MKNKLKLAEAIGIILGDGNIYISEKHGCFQLRIAGHSEDEKEYLWDFVKPLFEGLFNVNFYVKKHQSRNALYVCCSKRSVIETLLEFGLKPSNESKNKSTIPKWIKSKKNLLQACLRGLFDTDGCVYPLAPQYPNLLQIYFKNVNTKLLVEVRESLKRMGFHPSKICYNKIYITRKTEIIKYLKEIGFNNPKHTKKIAPWCSGQA